MNLQATARGGFLEVTGDALERLPWLRAVAYITQGGRTPTEIFDNNFKEQLKNETV